MWHGSDSRQAEQLGQGGNQISRKMFIESVRVWSESVLSPRLSLFSAPRFGGMHISSVDCICPRIAIPPCFEIG